MLLNNTLITLVTDMFNITITDLSGLHLHAGGAAGPLQVVYFSFKAVESYDTTQYVQPADLPTTGRVGEHPSLFMEWLISVITSSSHYTLLVISLDILHIVPSLHNLFY